MAKTLLFSTLLLIIYYWQQNIFFNIAVSVEIMIMKFIEKTLMP